MTGIRVVAVVPQPPLRFTTVDEDGISWPVTSYSGHVVLEVDPGTGGATGEPVTFMIPDGVPAMAPPRTPVTAEVGLRAFRAVAGAPGVQAGADEPRLDLVDGPPAKNKRYHLWPRLTFLVRLTGIEHAEINYRVVVEDS